MIGAIVKLTPSMRSRVLSALKLKGNRGKQFIRYSFSELETFASLLEESHQLTPEGFERFILQFNNAELDLLEAIIRGDDVAAMVQKENDRTRQMVKRLVARFEAEDEEKGKPRILDRVKSAFS
ncbi:hypothetical protein [Thiolapillus sp.]